MRDFEQHLESAGHEGQIKEASNEQPLQKDQKAPSKNNTKPISTHELFKKHKTRDRRRKQLSIESVSAMACKEPLKTGGSQINAGMLAAYQ